MSQLGVRHSCFVCERFALQQTATFKTVKGRAAVTTLNSQEIQRERKSLKKSFSVVNNFINALKRFL